MIARTTMLVASGAVLFAMGLANAQEARVPDARPTPSIEISETNEFDEHLLVATVTLDDEPLEGVEITFAAVRTFGMLTLGTEETFDDGTAVVDFPEGMPGNDAGILTIIASVAGSDEIAGATSTRELKSSQTRPDGAQSLFPAALWSAKPLWPLVAVIAALVAGVWSTYLFVVVQLTKLSSKETRS